MKSIKLATLGLTVCAVTIGGQVAHADLGSAKTTTDAEFTGGDRPDPIKPEEGPKTPDPIDPDPDPIDPTKVKPLPESKNVYVTHLPNISFGTGNKISAGGTEYEATTEKITKNKGAIQYYGPHYVQVADLSGSANTKWSVTVQQEDVYTTTAGQKLPNSRIRIYENSIRNSAYDNTTIANGVTGVDATSGFATIPVATKDTTTAPLEVASVKTAGATNNTVTSSIFTKDYDETNYDATKTPTTQRYTGIKLNVPQEDQAKTEKNSQYKANLTWTLSVAP